MRYAWFLPLILLVALLSMREAPAQEIAFSGAEIVKLAKAIVNESTIRYQLPSSYQMTMTNGHAMIITAPNAMELLCRAVIAWYQPQGGFPREVRLELHDLQGPAPDPKIEPKSQNVTIAVPAVDIGEYAAYWLQLAEAPTHTLPKAMTFPASYRLTAAQFIVAMSVLIDETMKNNGIPRAIAMPLVRSPQDWLSTERPVQIGQPVPPEEDPKIPMGIDLGITLNGIKFSESGPILPGKGAIPPFCGVVRLELTGYGPIGTIRLLLDNEMLASFDGDGPHHYEINTLPLNDGLHIVAATATNTAGTLFAYVFSFTVRNGRQSGFTPAEINDAVIELDAAPPKP